MEENKCRICGAKSQGFRICDDCHSKWDENRVICQICEQKKTSSKIGVCPTCKTPLVEEALNFLKTKNDYWNLIKDRVRNIVIATEREREIKCSTQGCKTKVLISSSNTNKVIPCPVCWNKMK